MTPTETLSAEALEVYEIWLNSYLTGDVKTYDQYLDDDYRFIGSTGNEEFLSRTETTEFFKATADQLAGKTEVRNSSRTIHQIGNLLFVTQLLDFWFLNEKKWSFYGRFRLTSVMHNRENEWKFIYQHFSTPDSKADSGDTIGWNQVNKENVELRDAIKRRTVELEHKSRELEIEAALERVRSRSMAMHQSEELAEVIQVVYDQLLGLKIPVDHAGFILDYKERDDMHIWLADHQQGVPSEITIPYFDSPHWNSFVEAKAKGKDFFANLLNFEEKNKFYKDLMELIPPMPKETVQNIFEKPGLTISTVLLDNVGLYIENYSGNPFTEEENATLMRFGKAFQQTYTRFLDLQKAEAQARESEIQLALERVRARTMAMQHSDELQEASFLLDEQVRALGIKTWGCAFNIYGEKDSTEWFGNEAGILPMYAVPRTGIFKEYYEKGQKGESLVIKEFSGDTCIEHYETMSSLPVIGEVLKNLKISNDGFPTYQIDHVVYFKYGYVLFITREHVPESHEIFKRFAKVFEQTYSRFLDLQKAENQAREAKIETALEKVRSRTMAMQKGEELKDVAVLLYKELIALGVTNFVTCGYVEIDENINRQYTWVTAPGGDTLGLFYLPLTGDATFDERYAAWKRQQVIFHQTVAGEVRSNHLEYAITTFNSKEAEEMVRSQFPDPTVFYCFNFSHGYLHIVSDSLLEKEEEKLLARFTKVFEQTYTRFLDLQNSEAQAREARIETALEKVRSRTMGMQKSDELADVANVLFEEMNGLVHNLWTCGFVLCEKEREEDEWWLSLEDGFSRGFFLPNVNDYAHAHLYEGWLKKDDFRTVQLEGDKLQAHYDWLMEVPVAKSIFDEMEAAGMQRPEWQKLHAAYFSKGYLVIITREPCPEEAIFKRFAQVFDLTYTRFLDLQKAEAQAKESQIELSLERIRAQVTGMQESADLLDIVVSMRTEFVNLGHEAHYFWHMRWLPETYKKAMTSGDGTKIGMVMTLPRHIHGDIPSVAAWEKTTDPIHVLAMDIDTAVDYVDKMITLGDFERVDPQAPTLDDIRHIGGLTFVMARTTHGEIGFSLPGVVPDPPKDSVDTLVRFAGVFDLAYRRFEDLKKAEAQARENRIELALERTRNQSMLMQHSDEIKGISDVFHQQLLELNIPSEFSYVWLPDESKNNHQFWASWAEQKKGELIFSSKQVTYPLDKSEPYTAACYKAWEDQENVHLEFIPPADISSFFDTWAELLDGAKNLKAKYFPEGVYYAEAYMRYGCFGINIRRELSVEEKQVLKRFSIEFERTYTRFLDLKKSEARAKESQVELSLERIRGQVTAMQESSDLFDIVVSMRKEFISLGNEADYFWHMRWLPDSYDMSMTSEDGSRVGMVISIPKFIHDNIPALAEWEKGNEATYALALDADGAWEYIEAMNTHGHYEQADPNAPTREDIEHIGGLTFVIARTTHGEIGYSLPGMVPEPPKEALDTLVRFAGVFDLAYKRFEDLKTAEKDLIEIKQARQKAEDALIELKATQTQLVQQEKLASLGQLTAGIAHEIKNPLNFVNNFSEVSVELIDEAFEELEKLDDSDAKEEIIAILNDVKSNLTKVHEHGSRADSIVKSMLQHSRGGSGKMEPTDLNALVKEYVNLAFHGMRAGKKPIDVDIQFDLDENLGNVNLIGEDFSRVLLNLCNNAFDACAERSRSTMREKAKIESEYTPKLIVRTKRLANSVEIQIEDNGPGIPDDLKDKILQPFFTTKKGTEGTGLGLSITNDIIKAHGGKLEIQSKPGKTVFQIIIQR